MTEILIALLLLAAPGNRSSADQLFKNGDWAGARSAYQALARAATDPGIKADLFDRIGQTFFEEGRFWVADSWFAKSITAKETAQAHYDRGRVYYFEGRKMASDPTSFGVATETLMNDSARELNDALRLDSKMSGAWLFLGYVEVERSHPRKAEAAFRRSLAIRPGQADAAVALSQLLVERRADKEAGRILGEIPEKARNEEAWLLLGDADSSLGRPEAAAKAYLRAIEQNVASYRAYDSLWRATVYRRKYGEFNRQMDRIAAAHPKAWIPHYFLAFSYRYDGHPARAVKEYEKTYALNPKDVRALCLAADVTQKDLKDDKKATSMYLDVLKKQPSNERAQKMIQYYAGQKAQLGDYAGAEPLLRALVTADPGDWTHAANLAIVMKQTGRVDEAVRIYRQTAEMFPLEPQIMNDLGILLEGVGRMKKAEAAFEEALDRDPNSLNALENLGSLARLQGRSAEALKYYERAYDIEVKAGADASKFRHFLDEVAREKEYVRHR